MTKRSKGKYRHFDHHQTRRHHHHTLSAELIRQRARGNLQTDDCGRPSNIEQGVFFDTQPEVEKEDRKNRIIPTRIEKHAESDEERYVATERRLLHQARKRLR
jgi:hypothetical protein